MASVRRRGIVKWFNEEKGYGFIAIEGELDMFVHYSGIDGKGRRNLAKGQVVEFYVENSKRTDRPNAIGVVVLE
jgi:cold shock protein